MDLVSKMAKIHAGFSELRASHVRLFAASRNGHGAPGHLLLFYAAECLLKYAHLRGNNLKTTEQLENTDHDLHSLIKTLRIPASVLGSPPTLRLSRRRTELCPHSSAHQAWRYGVRIEGADEARFIAWLEKVCEVVKEHS